jgi:predicted GTPase
MGAAGRDFHNFNVFFRSNEKYEVVAFTAEQIPGISGRMYPPELSGPLYPNGLPIYPEHELPELVKRFGVEQVILAYSDLSHLDVMHKASIALASGADFRLMGPNTTMLKSTRPIISVCAVRTGSGKSQTTRRVCSILKSIGKKVVVIRHPMPYGDLSRQTLQRYATYADLDYHECTIEEREEYEPHIDRGTIVYAGVDYEKILREAEKEADIIVWDGGNNDFPFYHSNLKIVVADPHRAGHEISYHPGEVNLRTADVMVINKIDSAEPSWVETVIENIERFNPQAKVVRANSLIRVEDPSLVTGKRVLVIEDGPTLTHGEMKYGAGIVSAKRLGAKEIIDPRPWAVGSIQGVFRKYQGLGPLLPAMGYGKRQISELEETINAVDCDSVLVATPIDLRRVMKVNKRMTRARYELEEIGSPNLEEILQEFVKST